MGRISNEEAEALRKGLAQLQLTEQQLKRELDFAVAQLKLASAHPT